MVTKKATMHHADGIRRVLCLYTGGTIGMKASERGYVCAPGYLPSLLKSLPMFHDTDYDLSALSLPGVHGDESLTPLITPVSEYGNRILYSVLEYNPLLDSCNMDQKDWFRIASDIYNNYEAFDAFVVLHGTDTMSFSSSVLSFMLENLNKTVVFTGSQIPLVRPRNDGIGNLLGAITIAGHFDIPEVCLYFDHSLYRANRTKKVDATSLTAFTSPNLAPLATVGITADVNWALVRPPPCGKLVLKPFFSNDIAIIRIFPGPFTTLRNNLRAPLRGVILETFGAGNAPDLDHEFLSSLREASERGVVIVNVTQCLKGCVEAHYATGVALREAGVVAGLNLTTEAALVKLGWLLGDVSKSPQEVRRLMQQDLRGEVTRPVRDLQFSLNSEGFLRMVYDAVVAQTRADAELSSSGTSAMTKIQEALVPTLLCVSSGQGHLDDIKSILAGRVRADVTNYDGRTALHLAASEGHVDTVAYLLTHGEVDVNAADRFHTTPLQNAIDGGHEACIRLLAHACPRAQLHKTPTELAAVLCGLVHARRHATLAHYLLAGVDVNAADYDGRTALHVAVCDGDLRSVALLLGAPGVRTDVGDRWGTTAAQAAESAGHAPVVKAIASHLQGKGSSPRLQPIASHLQGSPRLQPIASHLQVKGSSPLLQPVAAPPVTADTKKRRLL